MKNKQLEFTVGLFLAAGILCLGYLSMKVARKELFDEGGYPVQVLFTNCSGLKTGAPVMIAGVEIGRIKQIGLQDYEAKATLIIQKSVVLQTDVIASIKSKGLIGEKYIELTPGAADQTIPPGGTIRDTEPAMDIEGLISKFVNGSISKPAN